jgi:UDP-glucose 4-epimerase
VTRVPRAVTALHDASIAAWVALLAARARGPALAAMAVNLASGTPLALARVRERRRDVVAVAAPPLVGLAVLATLRRATGPALLATTVLSGLRALEVHRARRNG